MYVVNLTYTFNYCSKYMWAPSSEFVSSSIPSWQILTAHAQPFRGARDLAFRLKVPLFSLLVWASSGGSGETARMRRLAWTFAARISDKYQIRLARPMYHINLSKKCSWYRTKSLAIKYMSCMLTLNLWYKTNGLRKTGVTSTDFLKVWMNVENLINATQIFPANPTPGHEPCAWTQGSVTTYWKQTLKRIYIFEIWMLADHWLFWYKHINKNRISKFMTLTSKLLRGDVRYTPKKVNRTVQGVTQSEEAVNPWRQEEEKKDTK